MKNIKIVGKCPIGKVSALQPNIVKLNKLYIMNERGTNCREPQRKIELNFYCANNIIFITHTNYRYI